jgi:hypothetical protein
MRIFLKKEGKNRAPAPGIMNISRENARALVYTRIQTAANASRMETYRKNAADFKSVEWLATLDSHTCLRCAARDLKEYTLMDDPPKPIGHALPWDGGPGVIHWGCRCIAVGVVKPIKGLKFPIGQRASNIGPLPGNTDFEQFLQRKGRAFQDEVLGPGRAQLWRDKKLNLEQMLDARGQELTLAELKTKYGY